jgi:hypothetical protein
MSAQSNTQEPSNKPPNPPKKFKTIRKYKLEETDLDLLAKKAGEVLSAKPFQFQLIVEGLSTGCICLSKSPMALPVFFVKKKDGALRFVQDYRALNTMTMKNWYPLPLINNLINRLKGARFFTKLDVQWGFNNVWIREGDKWKAVFRTNWGLFEPLVMYFGLTNSPATFQTMMNDIFRDLILSRDIIVYLDDILITHSDLARHHEIVQEVLQRL